MKKLLLLIIPLILSCTRIVSLPNTEAYTETFYKPDYSDGFILRSLPADTSALMLEVYRPDTMQIIIPKGGFSRVLCMSSTYVGLLDAAGAADRIVAVSGRNYLTNDSVRARAAEVGYEGAMDYESLIAAKPEIALIYGIGGESAIAAKLDELGVPYVYVDDFEEQLPLGRAEWMVALGALVGKDARPVFNKVVDNYSPHRGTVSVMINAPYNGNWFIPGTGNYMSRLVNAAGMEFSVSQPEGTESRPVDMELALPALHKADIWLNPGQANTPDDLKALVPKAKFNGQVWNQNPDFYESGAARPDLILHELRQIAGGCAVDTLHYFRRIL